MAVQESIDVSQSEVVKKSPLIEIYPDMIDRNADELTLREVEKESKRFLNLVNSIRAPQGDNDHGLINPIAVRPVVGMAGRYALVDGFHRWTAWKEAFGNSKPIPAHVLNLTDAQVLMTQIIGNVHTKPTAPAENARQVRKILEYNPIMTVEDLANQLNVEPSTITSWMKLTNLPQDFQDEIDGGDMPISVGYVLAKFNPPQKGSEQVKSDYRSKQKEWYDRFKSITAASSWGDQAAQQFCTDCSAAAKRFKTDLKTGTRGTGEVVVDPVLRKAGEIKIEYNRVLTSFSSISEPPAVSDVDEVAGEYIHTAGYLEGLKWCLKVDDTTLNNRKTELETAANARQEKAEARKAGQKSESIARAAGNMFGEKRRRK